jgi:hypothetical protein
MVADLDAQVDLGTVGRVDGQLVVRFDHLVHRPLEDVWRTLTASPQRDLWITCGDPSEMSDGSSVQPPFWPVLVGDGRGEQRWSGMTRTWQEPTVFEWSTDSGLVRWELSPVAESTRLSLTACLASDDVEFAAVIGVEHHLCFERLVRSVEGGNGSGPVSFVELAELSRRYGDAAAVALADAD